MAMKDISVRFTGVAPLLQNNPQTVDSFNKFSKLKKIYTSKKKKTDDDLLMIKAIDVESKIFFDNELKIYVPSQWVLASIAKNSHALAKIAKAKVRGAVFTTSDKLKLTYENMSQVKEPLDIVENDAFITTLILPQQQIRLAKSFPIFHKWSFECGLEFDDTIIDKDDLFRVLQYGAKYGGFGDFRPTYGRAICEEVK